MGNSIVWYLKGAEIIHTPYTVYCTDDIIWCSIVNIEWFESLRFRVSQIWRSMCNGLQGSKYVLTIASCNWSEERWSRIFETVSYYYCIMYDMNFHSPTILKARHYHIPLFYLLFISFQLLIPINCPAVCCLGWQKTPQLRTRHGTRLPDERVAWLVPT